MRWRGVHLRHELGKGILEEKKWANWDRKVKMRWAWESDYSTRKRESQIKKLSSITFTNRCTGVLKISSTSRSWYIMSSNPCHNVLLPWSDMPMLQVLFSLFPWQDAEAFLEAEKKPHCPVKHCAKLGCWLSRGWEKFGWQSMSWYISLNLSNQ